MAVFYILILNFVTILVFGIDKSKAKKGMWRIPESTLLLMAVLGGSIGAWMGMRVWRHKTQNTKFKYGIPVVFIIQVALCIYLLYI